MGKIRENLHSDKTDEQLDDYLLAELIEMSRKKLVCDRAWMTPDPRELDSFERLVNMGLCVCVASFWPSFPNAEYSFVLEAPKDNEALFLPTLGT